MAGKKGTTNRRGGMMSPTMSLASSSHDNDSTDRDMPPTESLASSSHDNDSTDRFMPPTESLASSSHDNDTTDRDMPPTESLASSDRSSDSSMPVPLSQEEEASKAKRKRTKEPDTGRILRSAAQAQGQQPPANRKGPTVAFQQEPVTQAREQPPKRQKPQPQAGPSVAPAQSSKPPRTGKAPVAAQAGPPTTQPFKIDPDTILLLSALDSYHDFSGSRSCLDNIMVKDLIISFIKSDKSVLKSFNDFTVSKKINNKTLEHRVYEKYVTENENITTKLKIQLNTGKTKKDDITPEKVLDVLHTFFDIDKDKIFIINDSGSLTGCKKGLKYLTSYASWFDSGGCDDITKYPYNHSLTSSISVTKNSKDLLYIEKIEGLITTTNNAEGNLQFENRTANFNQTKNDDDRPEVPSYSSYIQDLTENTFFNGILSKLTIPRQQMFLMDLKRAGDGLQIVSGKDPTLDGLMKYPVFITNDIIAATISVNKGVRTVLTSKDHEALDDAVHSIKYANLLVPNNLLNEDDLKKRINAGLSEYAEEQEIQWGELSKQHIEELNKIIKDLTSKKTIPEFLNNIELFKKLKKEVQDYYDKYRLQIQNHIVLLKQKKTYDSNVDLNKTDLGGIDTAFNKTFEAIKTCNIFEVISTNLQKCFNKDRITFIDDYCKSSAPMMKKYLSYITNLIKNPNINDDYDYSLIPKLYDNINNIYDVIYNKEFFQNRRIIGTILDNTQITDEIKQLVINIRIAKILYKLFIADKLKYKEIIGYDSSTKANNHIKSPIGVIYMEYLLKLTTREEIETVIGVIKLLNSFSVLIDSEANRLIAINTTEKDKYLPTALKNYLSKKTQEVNPLRESNTQFPTEKAALIIKDSTYANKLPGYSGLLDFYSRIVHTHNTYMGIQTPNTTGGRSKKTGGRSKKTGGQQPSLKTPFENYKYTNLNDFMKHPFGVKEMIIKLCNKHRETILNDIFKEYYNSASYDINVLKKEVLILKETKKLIPQDHKIISGGRPIIPKIRNMGFLKKPLSKFGKQQTQQENEEKLLKKLKQKQELKQYKKELAFKLFVEYIDIFPEYIDPVMMIYMKYSKSPLPVYGLTKDVIKSSKK